MSFWIHFSSGRSGVFPGTGFSLEEEASRHATELHGALEGRSGEFFYAEEVRGTWEVVEHLEDIQRVGGRISFMDFHVHGGPGQIELGNDSLFHWERDLGGRRLEECFSTDARIEFHGCNVAAEPDGEEFLARCAWTLLRRNGGTAAGSNWYAFSQPDGTTPWSPGSVVTAEIRAGGHVQLRGHQHLFPERIRRRRERLWSDYTRVRRQRRPGAHDDLSIIETLLRNAERLLEGRPSYSNLRSAYAKLDSAEHALVRLDPGMAIPMTWGW